MLAGELVASSASPSCSAVDSIPPDGGKAIADIVGSIGGLAFYDLEPSLVPPSISWHRLGAFHEPLRPARARAVGPARTPQYWLFDARTKELVAGPAVTRALARQEDQGGRLPGADDSRQAGRDQVLGKNRRRLPGTSASPAPHTTYYYLVEHDPAADPPTPAMGVAEVEPDSARQDFDTNGIPIVTLRFTAEGDTRFREITRAEARRGRARGTPQHFAIVLDDQDQVVPADRLPCIFPDGDQHHRQRRPDHRGSPRSPQAQRFAILLRTGPLPVDVRGRFAQGRPLAILSRPWSCARSRLAPVHGVVRVQPGSPLGRVRAEVPPSSRLVGRSAARARVRSPAPVSKTGRKPIDPLERAWVRRGRSRRRRSWCHHDFVPFLTRS